MSLESDWPERYQAVLDQFFSPRRPIFSLGKQLWNPPTDIYECQALVIIKMEIAGMALEDMSITVQERQLIVRGRRAEDRPKVIDSYHLMEVRYGDFERSFEFPFRLESGKIKASYDKGFLCIEVPKCVHSAVSVSVNIGEVGGPTG
jgi:HSP20 family protein